jgi:hypothetical protein
MVHFGRFAREEYVERGQYKLLELSPRSMIFFMKAIDVVHEEFRIM